MRAVSEARVRWLGHRMHAELNVTVERGLTVEQGHALAGAVQASLLKHLPYLSSATIHVDPAGATGSSHHRPAEQAHAAPHPDGDHAAHADHAH